MIEAQIQAVRTFKTQNIETIEKLQQIPLLTERELIPHGRRRAIAIGEGAPKAFVQRGWLQKDGVSYDGGPLFHPFRLYVLHRILSSRLPAGSQPTEAFDEDLIRRKSPGWNAVVDLAHSIEPVSWPRIIGSLSFNGDQDTHRAELASHKAVALEFIRHLDPEEWSKIHGSIRLEAAWHDDNPELYILLRLATWDSRSKLTGRIAGSLWFLHMAEVIRRAFEEARSVQWPEEDQAIGTWLTGGRKYAFGSERPLDDDFRSKPYITYRFGLFTGSTVRWYVEGDTEYYAVDELLPEPNRVGIEIVNLRGTIAAGKNNAALKLSEMVAQDRLLRRFSIISFDLDVKENEKALRQLASSDQIVGSVAANRPDFEFANFTVGELLEIAASIAESHGLPATDLRAADWSNIESGAEFEKQYVKRSGGSLKGEEWGRALATYAKQHLRRADGAERPLWKDISAAIYCWNSNHDYETSHFMIDPQTLARVPRQKRENPCTRDASVGPSIRMPNCRLASYEFALWLR